MKKLLLLLFLAILAGIGLTKQQSNAREKREIKERDSLFDFSFFSVMCFMLLPAQMSVEDEARTVP